EGDNARPIGLFGGGGSPVAGGNRRLNGIGAAAAAKLLGALEGGQAPADQQAVPLRAILLQQENRFSSGIDAGFRSGCLNFHQGNESVHFRLVGNQLSKDASQAQRVFAKSRAHPVAAGSRGITLVEDEI